MALPEQAAGKSLQRRIKAHQGETAQFGLGGQKPIEWVSMLQLVTAGMHAMQERDQQQLKPLDCQHFGKILKQFVGRRQFAQAHLGGDLPTRRRTHMHPVARVSNGPIGRWRKTIGLSQPLQQGMGVEQQLGWMATAHSRGRSIAASSSSGSDSSNTSRGGKLSLPDRTPGTRRAWGGSSGTSRAQVLPPLATTIVSPAWAASIKREKWVLASCTFTMRCGTAVMDPTNGTWPYQISPILDQAGGHC